MACYQAEAFLDRAIASVQAQTMKDWRLIIVDDASRDGSASIASRYAAQDERIHLVQMPANSGPGAARKIGVDRATGDWIAILDADDAFLPERLARMVAVAEESRADLVFDNLILFDDHAGIETGSPLPVGSEVKAFGLHDLIDSERAGTSFRLGFLKAISRRSFLIEHGINYDPTLRSAEDFDIYARCLLADAQAILLHEPLYVYTTQVGAHSGVKSRGTHSRFTPGEKLSVIDRLIAQYRGNEDGHELELLRECRAWQRKRQVVMEMAELRHNGRIAAFIGMAAAHPAAAIHYVATSRAGKYLPRSWRA